MHEFGLCEPLVAAVRDRAAGRTVTGVRIRVGALHAVAEDAFTQAFTIAAQGTPAEHAAVDLVVTPAMVACRGCGTRSESGGLTRLCPGCGSADTEVTGGDELVLESIDVRDPEVTDVPRHPG